MYSVVPVNPVLIKSEQAKCMGNRLKASMAIYFIIRFGSIIKIHS